MIREGVNMIREGVNMTRKGVNTVREKVNMVREGVNDHRGSTSKTIKGLRELFKRRREHCRGKSERSQRKRMIKERD